MQVKYYGLLRLKKRNELCSLPNINWSFPTEKKKLSLRELTHAGVIPPRELTHAGVIPHVS